MGEKRNWKEYNEHLVRRGEIYVSLDFLENWDKELEKMNKGKRGRPYTFIHVVLSFYPYCISSISSVGRIFERIVKVYIKIKSSRLYYYIQKTEEYKDRITIAEHWK